ncbi:MAG: hypothetical protein ACREPM_15555 [Gemmatimonadaceae bacterium]
MPTPIDITVRPSATLTPKELDDIWAVTDRYVDTTRDVYEHKLKALPEVGLWRTRGGMLVGLVSLDTYRVRFEGRESIIFFTSSVVIDAAYRGRNLVVRTGLRMVMREKLKRPWLPAYWFFDTFSYKSYMLLPHYFGEFWPRRDRSTPLATRRFIDELARRRYGASWIAERGIVERSGHKRLRPTTAPVGETMLRDPDIAFFEHANPGHRDGDMLVCLAPLTPRNVAGALWRAVNHSRAR